MSADTEREISTVDKDDCDIGKENVEILHCEEAVMDESCKNGGDDEHLLSGEENSLCRTKSPRRVRDIHLDGYSDNMPDVDPYLLDEKDLDIESDGGGEAGSISSDFSSRSWKSLRTPRPLKPRSAASSKPRSSTSIASRARQIKDHESGPFLSIDLLPDTPSPVCSHRGIFKPPSHGSRHSLLSGSGSGQLSLISGKSDMSALHGPHSAGASVPRLPSAGSYCSPIKQPLKANANVKMPFKHATNTPQKIASQIAPSHAMTERTAQATHLVHKILKEQKPTHTTYIKGRLLKARLKPMEPVSVSEPTIQQCRGIISETRSYSACRSRTLRRWAAIMSGGQADGKMTGAGHEVKDRASTCESVHRTSEASSPDLTVDLTHDLDPDYLPVNLEDTQIVNGDEYAEDGRAVTVNSVSLPNSRSAPRHCDEALAEVQGPDFQIPLRNGIQSDDEEDEEEEEEKEKILSANSAFVNEQRRDVQSCESESVISSSTLFQPSEKDSLVAEQGAAKVSQIAQRQAEAPLALSGPVGGSKRPHSATSLQKATRASATRLRPKTAVDSSRKAVRFADQSKTVKPIGVSDLKPFTNVSINNGKDEKNAQKNGSKGRASCRPHSLDSGFHDKDDNEGGDNGNKRTFLTEESHQMSSTASKNAASSESQQNKPQTGGGKSATISHTNKSTPRSVLGRQTPSCSKRSKSEQNHNVQSCHAKASSAGKPSESHHHQSSHIENLEPLPKERCSKVFPSKSNEKLDTDKSVRSVPNKTTGQDVCDDVVTLPTTGWNTLHPQSVQLTPMSAAEITGIKMVHEDAGGHIEERSASGDVMSDCIEHGRAGSVKQENIQPGEGHTCTSEGDRDLGTLSEDESTDKEDMRGWASLGEVISTADIESCAQSSHSEETVITQLDTGVGQDASHSNSTNELRPQHDADNSETENVSHTKVYEDDETEKTEDKNTQEKGNTIANLDGMGKNPENNVCVQGRRRSEGIVIAEKSSRKNQSKTGGEEVRKVDKTGMKVTAESKAQKFFEVADYSSFSRTSHRPQSANQMKPKANDGQVPKARPGSGRPFSASMYPGRETKQSVYSYRNEQWPERSQILGKHGFLNSKARPQSHSGISSHCSEQRSEGTSSANKKAVSINSKSQRNGQIHNQAKGNGGEMRPKSASRVTFADNEEYEYAVIPRPEKPHSSGKSRTELSCFTDSLATSSGQETPTYGFAYDIHGDLDQMWEELPSDNSDVEVELVEEAGQLLSKFDDLESELEATVAELKGEIMKNLTQMRTPTPRVMEPENIIIVETGSKEESDAEVESDCELSPTPDETGSPPGSSGLELCVSKAESQLTQAQATMAKYQRKELLTNTEISPLLYVKTHMYVEAKSLKEPSVIKHNEPKDKLGEVAAAPCGPLQRSEPGLGDGEVTSKKNSEECSTLVPAIAHLEWGNIDESCHRDKDFKRPLSGILKGKKNSQTHQNGKQEKETTQQHTELKVETVISDCKREGPVDEQGKEIMTDRSSKDTEHFMPENYGELLQAYRHHCIENGGEEGAEYVKDEKTAENDEKLQNKSPSVRVIDNKKTHTGRKLNANCGAKAINKATKVSSRIAPASVGHLPSNETNEKNQTRPLSAATTDSGIESDCPSGFVDSSFKTANPPTELFDNDICNHSDFAHPTNIQGPCTDVNSGTRPSSGQKSSTTKSSKQRLEMGTPKTLEVVAEPKKLLPSKPRSGCQGQGDMPALVCSPPMCFQLNARPPTGFLYFFAYGLAMNPNRLTSYLGDDSRPRRFWALLFGFDLVFNKKGSEEADVGGFPNLEYNPSSSVEGCIYQLTPAQLEQLDTFMGYPKLCEHVVLPIWMSNCEDSEGLGVAQYCVPCVTFIAHDHSTWQEPVKPNEFALDQCCKAADALTPAYQEHLASFSQTHHICSAA